MLSTDTLHCYVLPGSATHCDAAYLHQYHHTLSFWREIIRSALTEEKNFSAADNLKNTHFTENDEAAVLFDQTQPIGLFMFRWLDLHDIDPAIHAALANRFSSELLDYLRTKKLSRLMLMGQLAIHPHWRKSSANLAIADILMGFAINRFVESSADALLTTTRNNRRTNALCYRRGGQQFSSTMVFNVESDTVFFERSFVKSLESTTLENTISRLWQDKTVCTTTLVQETLVLVG